MLRRMAKKVDIADLYRQIGHHLGTNHGAKGGTNAAQNLTAEQRTARAQKAAKAGSALLTDEQRSERARAAAAARWAKEREGKKGRQSLD